MSSKPSQRTIPLPPVTPEGYKEVGYLTPFEMWLEKEFPCHSVCDHETLGAYETWKENLRAAFDAGMARGYNMGIAGRGGPSRWDAI